MEPLFTKPGYVDVQGASVAKPPHPSRRGTHSPYVLWIRRDVYADTPVQEQVSLEELATGPHAARYSQWADIHRKVYPWANLNGDQIEKALATIVDRPVKLLRVIRQRHVCGGSTLCLHFNYDDA